MNPSELDPVSRLTRDLKEAAITLGRSEARFLVDAYYQIQEHRKRSGNQERALAQTGEPHAVITWLYGNMETLEGQIKRALEAWTDSMPEGRWAKSITGIGPVISAGLLAHIDITKARTAGNIWRFAGLDPTVTWEKGQRRPWNAALKTLCWKIGESFVKVSNNENDIYGKIYIQRKQYETAKNDNGEYAEDARKILRTKKISRDTDAYLWYAGGVSKEAAVAMRDLDAARRQAYLKMHASPDGTHPAKLPPAHIHSRAKRYAVKLFLSHLHDVLYRVKFGRLAPKPYPIGIMGHDEFHHIEVPNLDMVA